MIGTVLVLLSFAAVIFIYYRYFGCGRRPAKDAQEFKDEDEIKQKSKETGSFDNPMYANIQALYKEGKVNFESNA